jgi:hypothetical protein
MERQRPKKPAMCSRMMLCLPGMWERAVAEARRQLLAEQAEANERARLRRIREADPLGYDIV